MLFVHWTWYIGRCGCMLVPGTIRLREGVVLVVVVVLVPYWIEEPVLYLVTRRSGETVVAVYCSVLVVL